MLEKLKKCISLTLLVTLSVVIASESTITSTSTVYTLGNKAIHPYYKEVQVLVSPLGVCTEQTETLIVVHSAVKNFKQRKIIRESYGREVTRRLFNFDVLFVLGVDEVGKISEDVRRESETYTDLLIGDFKDSYSNITIKALFWLRFLPDRCPWTIRYLHADDDLMLDVDSILGYYNHATDRPKDEIHCLTNCHHGAHVRRDKKDKWYVSKEVFPQDVFPDYCSGDAYIFSASALPKLVEGAPLEEYLSIDDALLTGISRQNAKLGIKKAARFWLPFITKRIVVLDCDEIVFPYKFVIILIICFCIILRPPVRVRLLRLGSFVIILGKHLYRLVCLENHNMGYQLLNQRFNVNNEL